MDVRFAIQSINQFDLHDEIHRSASCHQCTRLKASAKRRQSVATACIHSSHGVSTVPSKNLCTAAVRKSPIHRTHLQCRANAKRVLDVSLVVRAFANAADVTVMELPLRLL